MNDKQKPQTFQRQKLNDELVQVRVSYLFVLEQESIHNISLFVIMSLNYFFDTFNLVVLYNFLMLSHASLSNKNL